MTMHPVAFAAWFGMLATALNLFPIGQLDGGHISYAVLGRKSSVVTLVMVVCLIGLAFWSLSWAVWAGLTVLMLVVFGPHHPRTADENVPLDPARKALARICGHHVHPVFYPRPHRADGHRDAALADSLEPFARRPRNALMTWTMTLTSLPQGHPERSRGVPG